MREPPATLTHEAAYTAILYLVLLKGIRYLIHEGTSCCDPKYPVILYAELFGPAGGDQLANS